VTSHQCESLTHEGAGPWKTEKRIVNLFTLCRPFDWRVSADGSRTRRRAFIPDYNIIQSSIQLISSPSYAIHLQILQPPLPLPRTVLSYLVLKKILTPPFQLVDFPALSRVFSNNQTFPISSSWWNRTSRKLHMSPWWSIVTSKEWHISSQLCLAY